MAIFILLVLASKDSWDEKFWSVGKSTEPTLKKLTWVHVLGKLLMLVLARTTPLPLMTEAMSGAGA